MLPAGIIAPAPAGTLMLPPEGTIAGRLTLPTGDLTEAGIATASFGGFTLGDCGEVSIWATLWTKLAICCGPVWCAPAGEWQLIDRCLGPADADRAGGQ